MFDKNTFKEAFRAWALSHRESSLDEAREYCRETMPANVCLQNHWLVDQCVDWFQWLQSRPLASTDWEDDDDSTQALVC